MLKAKKIDFPFKKDSNLTTQRSQKFTSHNEQKFALISASLFSVSLKLIER